MLFHSPEGRQKWIEQGENWEIKYFTCCYWLNSLLRTEKNKLKEFFHHRKPRTRKKQWEKSVREPKIQIKRNFLKLNPIWNNFRLWRPKFRTLRGKLPDPAKIPTSKMWKFSLETLRFDFPSRFDVALVSERAENVKNALHIVSPRFSTLLPPES